MAMFGMTPVGIGNRLPVASMGWGLLAEIVRYS